MSDLPVASSNKRHLLRKELFIRRLWRNWTKKWRRSLQFRAVAGAGFLLIITFGFVGSFLSHQIADSMFRSRLAQALEESNSGFTNVQSLLDSSDATSQSALESDISRFLTVLETTGTADSSRQWVLIPGADSSGFVPAQSQGSNLSAADIPTSLQKQVNESTGIFWQSSSVQQNQTKVPVLVVGTQLKVPQNPNYGLYLLYDLSPSQNTMQYINMVIWLAFGIMLVVVLSIVWTITHNVIRPISSTAISAEKLASGDLGERVVVKGENETSRLGISFNKMADSLEDQIMRLEKLSTMQQRFVSDVSHELRTPLTTVRMAAEMLYNGRDDLDATYRRPTELLYNQVDRFDALLSDLLEISRFDAGSASLDAVPVEFMAVVSDVLMAVEPHAHRMGIDVNLHSEVKELTVQMDHRRIERVLRNLLFNAVEHCEGKPIDMYIAASDTAVGVAVRDHGVGLNEEQISQVFNRFWRADPSRKRTLGGTGLGLSIAAEDVRLHQGKLEAWGELGLGACFRMTLPLTQDTELGESPVLMSGEPEPIQTGSIGIPEQLKTFGTQEQSEA